MKTVSICLFIVISFQTLVHGQWKSAEALTGGSIVTDLIEFKGDLYAAFSRAGVFRSINDGDSWERLAVPGQPNPVHFVVHGEELLAISYGKVFRTADGAFWSEGPGPEAFVNDATANGTAIYVAGFNGIYRSADAGLSWERSSDAASQIDLASVAANDTAVWVGATEQNKGVMFVSSDEGATWSKVVNGNGRLESIFLSVHGILINIPYDGVFRSVDNGATWQRVRQAPGPSLLWVTPAGVCYSFSNHRLSVSHDGGTSWTERGSTMMGYSHSKLYVNDDHAYVGTWGGGIFRSSKTSDEPWEQKNTGINAMEILDIAVLDQTIFAGTHFSFIHSTDDGGATWTQQLDAFQSPAGDARNVLVVGSDIFVGQGGGGIQRSSDRGVTWTRQNNGLDNWLVESLGATETHVFAATREELYSSGDRGENWTRTGLDITSVIRTLHGDGENLYVGTYDGLFLSENQGVSSVRISDGLPDESVGVISQVGTTLFAATQFNGLHKTSNAGQSWEVANVNPVHALAARNNAVFMSSNNGQVYVSIDTGKTWKDIAAGLPPGIPIVSFGFTESHILVGSQSGIGLWTRPLVEILPPYITVTTPYATRFRIGHPIIIQSDQELYSEGETLLTTSNTADYISVTDGNGTPVDFTAEIASDTRQVSLLVNSPINGEAYAVTIQPLRNEKGLASPLIEVTFTAFLNTVPEVQDIALTGQENGIVELSSEVFLNAYSDPDGDPLEKVSIKSLPLHGVLKLSGTIVETATDIEPSALDELSYVPNPEYSGADQFAWTASDGLDYATDALVNLEIAPVTSAERASPYESPQIFPNPVQDVLYVALPSINIEDAIAIIDIFGKPLDIEPETDGATRTFDLSNLPPGIYVLQVTVRRQQFRQRVIKR